MKVVVDVLRRTNRAAQVLAQEGQTRPDRQSCHQTHDQIEHLARTNRVRFSGRGLHYFDQRSLCLSRDLGFLELGEQRVVELSIVAKVIVREDRSTAVAGGGRKAALASEQDVVLGAQRSQRVVEFVADAVSNRTIFRLE